MSDDAAPAYLTCEHLGPLEKALSKAGIKIDTRFTAYIFGVRYVFKCWLLRNLARELYSLPDCVVDYDFDYLDYDRFGWGKGLICTKHGCAIGGTARMQMSSQRISLRPSRVTGLHMRDRLSGSCGSGRRGLRSGTSPSSGITAHLPQARRRKRRRTRSTTRPGGIS